MAKLVWLGEPENNDDGPRKNEWNGITFLRGEEVEVTDERMIAKAKRNPFYSVDGKTYVPNGAQPHPNAEAGPVVRDRTQLGEMTIAELREEAAKRGIESEGLTKAELREKLAQS